jgi:hypothetical protein
MEGWTTRRNVANPGSEGGIVSRGERVLGRVVVLVMAAWRVILPFFPASLNIGGWENKRLPGQSPAASIVLPGRATGQKTQENNLPAAAPSSRTELLAVGACARTLVLSKLDVRAAKYRERQLQDASQKLPNARGAEKRGGDAEERRGKDN